MKVNTTNRWNITRRFIKHSEALLQENIQSEEELILLFLQAINEVFLQNQMTYLQKGVPLCLHQARLINSKKFNEKHVLRDSIKLSILKLENGMIEHSIYLPNEELKGNKAKYLELICNVYASVLREFTAPKTSSLNKENSEEEPWSNRVEKNGVGKYRQQKSVILNLEQYTRQKPKRGRPTGEDPPNMMSEFEQEIIEYQNNMLKDLEEKRERIHDLELINQQIIGFYRKLLNEVAITNADLISTIDKVNPEEEAKREQLKPLRDVFRDKTMAHKNFLDLLLSIENSGKYPSHQEEQPVNCLEWVHNGIAGFSEGNDGKEVSFELQPKMNKHFVLGEPKALIQMQKTLFELIHQVSQLYSSTKHPLIRIGTTQRGKNVELLLEIGELNLPIDWKTSFSPYSSIFDTVRAENFDLAVKYYFLNETAVKNGGKLNVVSEERKELKWVITLKRGGQ